MVHVCFAEQFKSIRCYLRSQTTHEGMNVRQKNSLTNKIKKNVKDGKTLKNGERHLKL
mgnify:CR=1 FL=1